MSERPYSQRCIYSDMGDQHILERWSHEWFNWIATDDRGEEIAGALRDIANTI